MIKEKIKELEKEIEDIEKEREEKQRKLDFSGEWEIERAVAKLQAFKEAEADFQKKIEELELEVRKLRCDYSEHSYGELCRWCSKVKKIFADSDGENHSHPEGEQTSVESVKVEGKRYSSGSGAQSPQTKPRISESLKRINEGTIGCNENKPADYDYFCLSDKYILDDEVPKVYYEQKDVKEFIRRIGEIIEKEKDIAKGFNCISARAVRSVLQLILLKIDKLSGKELTQKGGEK